MRYFSFSSLVLVLTLFLALFSSKSQAQDSINLWFTDGELERVLQKLSEQFTEQNGGVQVNVVNLPNEELKASIVRTVRNDLAPDIAVFTSDNTAYAPMMKLSSFDASQLNPYWDESILESLAFNGRIHGLPLQRSNRLLMFYNKALVQFPAREWETLLEQAPDLLTRNLLPVGVLYDEPYWFAHFATHFSAQFTLNDRPTLNTLEMAESLKFFKQLVDAQVIRNDCGYDCVSKDFYQGKVAYALNGVWAINEAAEALGNDLGITPLPTLDGRAMKALTSIVMLTFPNDSWHGPNQKVIRAFAKFLRTEQAQIEIAIATKMLPINLQWLTDEFRTELHADQLSLTDENHYMPATLSYIAMWNGMKKGLVLHSNEHLNAIDAAQYMQKVTLENQQRLVEMVNLP